MHLQHSVRSSRVICSVQSEWADGVCEVHLKVQREDGVILRKKNSEEKVETMKRKWNHEVDE